MACLETTTLEPSDTGPSLQSTEDNSNFFNSPPLNGWLLILEITLPR